MRSFIYKIGYAIASLSSFLDNKIIIKYKKCTFKKMLLLNNFSGLTGLIWSYNQKISFIKNSMSKLMFGEETGYF